MLIVRIQKTESTMGKIKFTILSFLLFCSFQALAENNGTLLNVTIGNQSTERPNEKIKLYIDKEIKFNNHLPVKGQHHYEEFNVDVDVNIKHHIIVIAEDSLTYGSIYIDVTKNKYVQIEYNYDKIKKLSGFSFYVSNNPAPID